MAKLLVLITSGPDEPAKVKAGLGFARVAKDSGRVEDVLCCFFADGVEVLTPANRGPFESLLNSLWERQILVMACQFHAEQKGIPDQIRQLERVDLHYVGTDLVEALNQGFEFVTF